MSEPERGFGVSAGRRPQLKVLHLDLLPGFWPRLQVLAALHGKTPKAMAEALLHLAIVPNPCRAEEIVREDTERMREALEREEFES